MGEQAGAEFLAHGAIDHGCVAVGEGVAWSLVVHAVLLHVASGCRSTTEAVGSILCMCWTPRRMTRVVVGLGVSENMDAWAITSWRLKEDGLLIVRQYCQ